MFAQKIPLSALCLIFAVVIGAVEARPVPGQTVDADELTGGPPWVLTIVCVGGIVCMVIILVGCAEFCRKHSGFKDFDNEESFTPTDVVPSGPAAEFSLYPPVESTPDTGNVGPIIFEPLPDLPGKRPKVSNASALRPKVSTGASGRDRVDSEESLEDIIERDSMQDKLKLQNLLMGPIAEPPVASLVDLGCEFCNTGDYTDTELCTRTARIKRANSRNQLPRSQLQYIKELGTGYFGKVLQGEGQRILPGHKKTKVVIQMLNEEADPHDQLTFLQEALPYRETDHLNVMKVLGQCVETMPYLVVLELCPFGDLKTYLRSHRIALDSFNEKGLLLKFASDMAAGLQALHQGNYIHHDFAIRNCLLASDLTVKIGDYGMSEESFKEDYYFDGNGDAVPIRWLAPESLGFLDDGSPCVRRISKESNIWSFGVALWECVQFGTLPYSDLNNELVLRLVIKEKSIKLPKPDLPVSHLDRLYQLINLCQSEPAQRPSLRELRIMLLHLLSSKTNMDTSAFDTKWNQLMPRRAPQVTNVSGGVVSDGPIQTVAGSSSAATTAAVNGSVPRSRPSDFSSELVQLDASRLDDTEETFSSLHDELMSASNREKDIEVKKKTKVETPSNELSLEAELSAAFASTTDVDLSLDEDIMAASTPKSETGKEFPALTEDTKDIDKVNDDDENEKSNDSLEESSKIASAPSPYSSDKSEPQEIRDTPGATIILEDESFAESPVPDIVATSLIKSESETPPDFMTSTPKKPDADKSSDIGADTTQYQSLTDNSTQYLSALSSQHSTDADDSEEFSFLGEKKFAALLQTVPSYEADDSEFMSSFGSTSLDKSTDEMISERSGNVTPTPAATASDTDQKLVGANQNDSTTTIQGNDSVLQESPLMPADEQNKGTVE